MGVFSVWGNYTLFRHGILRLILHKVKMQTLRFLCCVLHSYKIEFVWRQLEPAFFGVPIVVTHSANVIERRLAEHYVSYWKDAVRIFKLEKCLRFIREAANGSERYNALKANRVPREAFGGDGIAEVIFAELDEKFHILESFEKDTSTR